MNFDKIDKNLFYLFLVFASVDIACCFFEGNSFCRYYRPCGWIFFAIFTLKYFRNEVKFYLLFVGIVAGCIADYLYYSYGGKARSEVIWCLIFKDLTFLIIFIKEINTKIILNRKFFEWFIFHTVLAIVLWSVLDVEHSMNGFILTLVAFYLLLVISLNRTENYIFRQSYIGLSLVIISVIFSSIHVNDDNPIVEMLDRITQLTGYFLIFCGLLNIRVLKN